MDSKLTTATFKTVKLILISLLALTLLSGCTVKSQHRHYDDDYYYYDYYPTVHVYFDVRSRYY